MLDDMVLERYGTLNAVASFSISRYAKLIRHISRKNAERYAWERWLVEHQASLLMRVQFESFGEYLDKVLKKDKPVKVVELSTEEILADYERITADFNRKKGMK